MSAHTEPIADGIPSREEILKRNDTVVAFESPAQAITAMLENYRANSRVWFDNRKVEWPWKGSFHQPFTNLPSDTEERRRFATKVVGAFHELFPVQRVYCYDTYVLVLADGESARKPKDWGSMTLG